MSKDFSLKKSKENLIQAQLRDRLFIRGYEKLYYVLHLLKINCKNKAMNLISFVDYDKDGHALDSDTKPKIPFKKPPRGAVHEKRGVRQEFNEI